MTRQRRQSARFDDEFARSPRSNSVSRAARVAGAAACLLLLGPFRAALAEPAHSDRSLPRVVPHHSCEDALYLDRRAARWEWTRWLQAGYVSSSARDSAAELGAVVPVPLALGLGVEATAQLLTYLGFPSQGGENNGRAEVRAGAWAAAVTRPDGGLVEGGLVLHLGGIYAPGWGVFDARLGTGYGAFSSGRTTHAVATLTWGARNAPERTLPRGFCDPPRRAPDVAQTFVVRGFVTWRRPWGRTPVGHELVLGIELSPSLSLFH